MNYWNTRRALKTMGYIYVYPISDTRDRIIFAPSININSEFKAAKSKVSTALLSSSRALRDFIDFRFANNMMIF